MGHDFRIKTIPAIGNLREIVVPILEVSEQIIDSSLLVSTPQKLGITSGLIGTSWPQCCDLMIEETGAIYAIGNNSLGCQIINRLVQYLKNNGYKVEIVDDL